MNHSLAEVSLMEYLRSFSFLSENDIENFIGLSSDIVQLQKGEYYIREGEISKNAAFLVSGILRSFYTSDVGDEFTYCITFPNNLASAYSSFINGKSTEENIQAITPVTMLVFEKEKIMQLTANNNQWTYFLKWYAGQQYIELEKRIFQLHKFNASQRYTFLLKNQPELLQYIPLQYLASYLGVTQRHLSRIRKEISF